MAGLTAEGLVIKRLPEVLSDIVTSEQENIDPDISTRDDELLGQLNTIISAAISEQWELAEAVNDNFKPLKAEGTNLDDLVALIGLRRIAASKSSTTTQEFTGTDGTVVPTTVILENVNTKDRYNVTTSVTLTSTACLSAEYSVSTVADNELYTINVNSTAYPFTSDGDATELEILDGIKALIDADGGATWSATVDTEALTLKITTADSNTISVTTLTTFLTVGEVTAATTVEADEDGPLSSPSGTVTGIIVGVGGLTSTTNPDAYSIGRLEETDEELRARFAVSHQITGAATVEAIQDTISNLSGVTTAVVVENDQITVDGSGRPAKSFESVVQGGDDDDIANAIWLSKPAGIETFGSTTIIITDSNGDSQSINFSRPTQINIAIRVTYSLYDEESFPSGGETTIAETAVSETNALGLDVDVIPTRYFGPIYTAVSGINTLLVEIQQIANPGDTPVGGSWSTAKLPIAVSEFAQTTDADITVVVT